MSDPRLTNLLERASLSRYARETFFGQVNFRVDGVAAFFEFPDAETADYVRRNYATAIERALAADGLELRITTSAEAA
jgi:hypothetical protein